jgi:LmbE family N-acetylglucosaminyl deacetylase
VIESSTPARALAVFAHPDDPEVGCGGTLARWSAAGADVHLVVACRGEKGSMDATTDPEALAAARSAEVARAAEVLGVASVEELGHPDGDLENDAALREQLVGILRGRRPDAVIAPDPTAVFFGDSYVNHRDHRQLGWAVLDSLVPAASPLYARGQGEAHQVGLVLLAGTLEPDAWVDIADVLETKVRAVSCHESRLGADPDLVAAILEQRAAEAGRAGGLRHAEAFRAMRFAS